MSLSALEDGGPTTLDVLGNDTGDTLTITDANAPAPQHGATTTDGATITYTPDPDFNGVDTFGYTITDAELRHGERDGHGDRLRPSTTRRRERTRRSSRMRTPRICLRRLTSG